MEKLKMQSRDAVESNVEKIAALFPQCVTERHNKDGQTELAIDFDKLRAELSKEVLDEGEDRYQFTWPDKRAASRLANTPTDQTLRPDIKSSVDFWNTENLYIEGDNLDVLKVLRENYLGKIKMIYIDPPYNTGNDFVYNDDFNVNTSTEESRNGLFNEAGMQVLSAYERNTVANGRFHTDWLNMIYPRLKVARDLLADDGVIFISIDDNEVRNLKIICDEIFSADNFIAQLVTVMNLKGNNDQFGFAGTHEYTLVYAKSLSNLSELRGIAFTKEDESEYTLSDSRGFYKVGATLMRTGEAGAREKRPKGYYPIYVSADYSSLSIERENEDDFVVYPKSVDGKEMSWRRSPENLMQTRTQFIIKPTSNGISFYKKQYLDEDKKVGKKPKTLFYKSEYSSGNGTACIKELFGGRTFDNPKPLTLIQDICMIGSEENAIILDFFSGSATTAHAVMKLNAEDGGKRKFIMVQLPEVANEKSEARKAGYETICQIGEERIRRAGKKVKEEAGLKGQDLDTGFRVLKLDSSNMEDVFYKPEDFNAQNLFNTIDNVKPDRTPLDLLFQVMPELNIELSAKIEEKEVNGKKVFFINDTYLIATFDKEVSEPTVTEIAKMKPQYFVMRDASAANDNVLDNFEQIFKHYSPDTTRKIL